MFGFGPISRWLAGLARPTGADSAGLWLSATDVAELTEIGRRVAAEHGQSSPTVITTNLARLMGRRVPVRAVRPGAIRTLGVLCFADGTTVIVKGHRPGDLGRIAAGIYFGRVELAAFRPEGSGVTVEVRFGRRQESLSALGITQPA